MQLDDIFNLDELPESSTPLAMPAGYYPLEIKESEVKATKNGNGQYIKIRFDVIGGDYAGRVIFENINVRNPNEVAEKIGRQQLGEIMRATGVASLTDTDQLVGQRLVAKLAVKKDDEYGDLQGNVNVVKAYKAIEGSAAPMPSGEKAPQKASGAAKPPWAK